MPSNRKRIGFLPSEEVHKIIEEICNDNKHSQSRVTGILVEEALRSRGYLKNEQNAKSFAQFEDDNTKDNNHIFKSDLNDNSELFLKNEQNIAENIKFINEYIEFKLFKKIISKNKNILG